MNWTYVFAGLILFIGAFTIIRFVKFMVCDNNKESDTSLNDETYQAMVERNKDHQMSCHRKSKSTVFCHICGGKVSDNDNAVLMQAIQNNVRNHEQYFVQYGVQHLFPQFDGGGRPTCPGSKSRATKMKSLLTERAKEFYRKFWSKLSEEDGHNAKPLSFEDDPKTLGLYEEAKNAVKK